MASARITKANKHRSKYDCHVWQRYFVKNGKIFGAFQFLHQQSDHKILRKPEGSENYHVYSIMKLFLRICYQNCQS